MNWLMKKNRVQKISWDCPFKRLCQDWGLIFGFHLKMKISFYSPFSICNHLTIDYINHGTSFSANMKAGMTTVCNMKHSTMLEWHTIKFTQIKFLYCILLNFHNIEAMQTIYITTSVNILCSCTSNIVNIYSKVPT